MLLDTHHHLDFLPPQHRQEFLAHLADNDVLVVAQTLTPADFVTLDQQQLTHPDGSPLMTSVGFHPWRIGSADRIVDQLDLVPAALERTRFVGEIGLDFSPRRLEEVPADRQVDVLRRLFTAIDEISTPNRPIVLSLHAVRSAGQVMDLLDEVLATSHAVPVFHRFGGSGDDLARIIRTGGYLSVGPQMLATRRGRAYASQVPAERLLLETDLPPEPVSGEGPGLGRDAAQAVIDALTSTVSQLQELRQDDVLARVAENQAVVYGV